MSQKTESLILSWTSAMESVASNLIYVIGLFTLLFSIIFFYKSVYDNVLKKHEIAHTYVSPTYE